MATLVYSHHLNNVGATPADPPERESSSLSSSSGSNSGSGSSLSTGNAGPITANHNGRPSFARSASSPSMHNCFSLKTLSSGSSSGSSGYCSNNSGSNSIVLSKISNSSATAKDDTDLNPEDVIVDPKSHTAYRKGRLIGKGGFAKVYEVTKLSLGSASELTSTTSGSLADKIIDKEVFSRRSTSKDKVCKVLRGVSFLFRWKV